LCVVPDVVVIKYDKTREAYTKLQLTNGNSCRPIDVMNENVHLLLYKAKVGQQKHDII